MWGFGNFSLLGRFRDDFFIRTIFGIFFKLLRQNLVALLMTVLRTCLGITIKHDQRNDLRPLVILLWNKRNLGFLGLNLFNNKARLNDSGTIWYCK